MEMGFLSWELLATFAGATAATALVTEFMKSKLAVIKGGMINLVSYLVALAVILMAGLFTGSLEASGVVLALLNAIVVSTAANGLYDDSSLVAGLVQRMAGR